MSYTPPREMLRGLSLDVAELYGKPHIGAFFRTQSPKSHKLEEGARCPICGRPATNAHHVVPLSKGDRFRFDTGKYMTILRSPLFALCGSGTTGCHNDFHGGARFHAHWKWLNDFYAKAWWDGRLLQDYGAHSRELFKFGRWEIEDSMLGKRFVFDDYLVNGGVSL